MQELNPSECTGGSSPISAPEQARSNGHAEGSETNPPNSFADEAPAVQIATRDTKTTAHAGMLDAAKAIIDDIKHTGVLEALLNGQAHAGKHRIQHDCK